MAEDAYLGTVDRMEPDIAMVDRDAALASIAVSLKRIADTQDVISLTLQHIEMNLRKT